MLVIVGKAATGGQETAGKALSVKFATLDLGGQACDIRAWYRGKAPEIAKGSDTAFTVGGQAYTFDGAKIVIGAGTP